MAQTAANQATSIAMKYSKPALNSPAETLKTQVVKCVTAHRSLAVTAAITVSVVAAPALVSAPLLSAAGFSAQGVQGYSLAAGVQSIIGNVGVGSAFATLQSAGAGGAGLAAVNGITQVGAAVAGIGTALKSFNIKS
ncbi:hypothetical protein N8T08_000430 [Aspergillus melleus]|uniref:Uncharacterized protein n=1 Tax=Aspergillus melleus TaxID=138277 RepID=A0ACC3BBL7_9EURO|nr:hypothetical protein N8T08_000430 [Aspergillus melleus]